MDVNVPLQFGWCMYCLFTAVGAALHTAARVDAAPFAAVGVRVMLPILQRFAYVLPFTPLLG